MSWTNPAATDVWGKDRPCLHPLQPDPLRTTPESTPSACDSLPPVHPRFHELCLPFAICCFCCRLFHQSAHSASRFAAVAFVCPLCLPVTSAVLTMGSTSFDDASLQCSVAGAVVCAFRARFGRLNGSSCSFLVPSKQQLGCATGPGSGMALCGVTAVPLAAQLIGPAETWSEMACPFSGANCNPNDCPCAQNGSATADLLMTLRVASPDAGDNSIWCCSSGNECLCSFSWNAGEGDSGSCTFFLPAGEQLGCKIQFGHIDVIAAR